MTSRSSYGGVTADRNLARGEKTMRVVRVGAPPVVVRLGTRDGVLVAVPDDLSPETVLTLARLVLSTAELIQLEHRLQPDQPSCASGPTR
jgi:hypothetical protein